MSVAKWLGASAAGAAAAYFFDPRSGRRRRGLLRDSFEHAKHTAARGLVGAASDLEHRAHGASRRARTAVIASDVDDTTLVARVRSRLGRVSGSVHGISVASKDGIVTLTGHVLRDEADSVLRTVRSTAGTRDVVDELERSSILTTAAAIPRIPAAARRRRGYWYPSTRLAVGTSAAAAVMWGLLRGGPAGAALLSIGAAGLLRSTTNQTLGELTGLGASSRGIDVQKTMRIRAPVEDVYRFFTAFESFPRFMRHVESVQRVDDNRWRFRLAGPAGMKAELDARLLRVVPNELFAWTSAENASIEHTGSVRFERMGPNATRVTIRMTYRPPAGLIRQELAALFHADPKHELDEDMLRLQSLLEHGRATGRDGKVTILDLPLEG